MDSDCVHTKLWDYFNEWTDPHIHTCNKCIELIHPADHYNIEIYSDPWLICCPCSIICMCFFTTKTVLLLSAFCLSEKGGKLFTMRSGGGIKLQKWNYSPLPLLLDLFRPSCSTFLFDYPIWRIYEQKNHILRLSR